jgi:hypothetical protein
VGDTITTSSFLVSSVLNAIPATAGSVSSTYLASGSALANIGSGGVTQTYLATGVAGTGPAFRAYSNSTQTFTSSTFTKIGINTTTFDTNSNFSTANNRFQPTVAGYYQFNGCAYYSASVSMTSWFLFIYKNGSVYSYGNGLQAASATALFATVNDIIYLNGSTDYVELYGYITGTGTLFCNSGVTFTFFSGALVRAA